MSDHGPITGILDACEDEVKTLAYTNIYEKSLHHTDFVIVVIYHENDPHVTPIATTLFNGNAWKEVPVGTILCGSFGAQEMCEVVAQQFPHQHITINTPPKRGAVKLFLIGFGDIVIAQVTTILEGRTLN